MIITATQTNTRQAPRKVRLVANAVRKMPLDTALRQLAVIERRASILVLKVIRQAIANAQHNHGAAFADLSLKNITVDSGPHYKRFRAVSRGRGHQILKKTSHVTVQLEYVSAGEVVGQKSAPTAPVEKESAQQADAKSGATKTTKTTKVAKAAKKSAAATETTKKPAKKATVEPKAKKK
ncbi:MAG: 50S ribosomal protein L22 [Patescibacteria group bacterium]